MLHASPTFFCFLSYNLRRLFFYILISQQTKFFLLQINKDIANMADEQDHSSLIAELSGITGASHDEVSFPISTQLLLY